jgi:hypothetical protein
MARYAENTPCDNCGGPTTQIHLPSGVTITSDPVVVFKAPDGSYRFPGDPNGLSAKTYEKVGYTRVELRGWAEVRRFERDVNTKEASEIARKVEKRLEMREIGEKMRRSEVIHGLRNGFQIPETDEKGRRTGRMKTVKLSAFGRDLMHSAMQRNDGKPRPKEYSPGFFVDAFANDRSNRDEARRPDGKRFRD